LTGDDEYQNHVLVKRLLLLFCRTFWGFQLTQFDDMESAGSRPKDDVSLPKATMTKIIKEMLPPDVRVAKDAQDLLVECCVGILLTRQPDSLQLLLPNWGMFLIQL
jgi:hypothetical protein